MAQLKSEETKNENGDNNNDKNDKQPVVKSASQIANLKQLKIQSGALKRYTKELQMYMKELNDLKAELDEIRNGNDDEKQNKQKKIKVKQQRQAIEETANVIRDIRPKLVSTWENVDHLMQELNGFVGDEDEQKILTDASKFLENAEPLVND